jgi:endonuclease/exonuclease/phosphatase (EEP) superfamily protein YafD
MDVLIAQQSPRWPHKAQIIICAIRTQLTAIVSHMIRRQGRALAACILGFAAVVSLTARAVGNRPFSRSRRLSEAPVQAAALAPAATVAGMASVALAASVDWWLAGLLTIPVAFLAASQLPRRHSPKLTSESVPNAPGPATLRILTLNALLGNANPTAVVSAVRRYEVDVVAIQELTPKMVRRLAGAGMLELLPSAHADPRPRAGGSGLWSRYPLIPLPPAPGLRAAAPSARIVLQGLPVTLRAVHPVAPLMGRCRAWHEDLSSLREVLAATPGAQVVAGDFNASRDHRPFRELLAAGFADCADIAAQRHWPGFTWPANRRYPPVMRLDHILVSPGIAVTESRTIRIPGTDHRGVLAVLELVAATVPETKPAPVQAAATQRGPE